MKIRLAVTAACLITMPALAYLSFYEDGFNKANGWNIEYGKWIYGGSGTAAVSNNLGCLQPADASWGNEHIRPLDAAQHEASFDVAGGIVIEMNIGPLFALTPGELETKISVLNQVVNTDPYAMGATGVVLHLKLYSGQASLNVQPRRKLGDANSNGTDLGGGTDVVWVAGARLTYLFNATTLTVSYNGAFIYAANHGVTVSDWPAWYCGILALNVDVARGRFCYDNVKITGPGAAVNSGFYDDFTGTTGDPVNNNKWYKEKGSATIDNNQCKLVPDNWSWGGASIMAKADDTNSLRLDSSASALVFSTRVAQVEFATTRAGDDLIYRMEWYPELNYNDAWEFNATSLACEVYLDFDLDGSQTNVYSRFYRYYAEASRDVLFTSSSTRFVAGAPIVFIIDRVKVKAYYGDWQMGTAAHGIPFAAYYSNGVFFEAAAQNADTGRGAVYLDELRVVKYSVVNPSGVEGFAGNNAIELSWTKNANGNNVMVAYSTSGIFGIPVNDTSYSAGAAIAGGGTVIYNSGATEYDHTGLDPNTDYYYTFWSVDGNNYYSPGISRGPITTTPEPGMMAAAGLTLLVLRQKVKRRGVMIV